MHNFWRVDVLSDIFYDLCSMQMLCRPLERANNNDRRYELEIEENIKYMRSNNFMFLCDFFPFG